MTDILHKALNKKELSLLKSLNTPRKIQNFINLMPANFEPHGPTCFSPRRTIQENRMHCVEGAMFSALALRFHGQPALLLDLTTSKDDFDHVVAPFKYLGCWGAISKSNHAVLRYRDPIYKTIRELVMSYFHEYTNDFGRKTLRSYAGPINLKLFDARGWMTDEENVWYIPEYLADLPHKLILNQQQIRLLRQADEIEKQAGQITEYKKS